MLAYSLTTRAALFAYVIGPPRFVPRAEAAAVYNAVCEKLGLDDMSLRYEQPPDPSAPPGSDAKVFSIVCKRTDGSASFTVTLDHARREAPLRLLMECQRPASDEHVYELTDMAAEAVLETVLPARGGEWDRLIAETRLRFQCGVPGNDALAFLRRRVLAIPNDLFDDLGARPTVASVRFEVASGPILTDTLESPKRELLVEVLREDPKSLYVEMVSQWAQIPLPTGLAGPHDDLGRRPVDRLPREYIAHERRFIEDWLARLSREVKVPQ